MALKIREFRKLEFVNISVAFFASYGKSRLANHGNLQPIIPEPTQGGDIDAASNILCIVCAIAPMEPRYSPPETPMKAFKICIDD